MSGCQGPYCHGAGGWCGCDCKCCPPSCCSTITVNFVPESGTGGSYCLLSTSGPPDFAGCYGPILPEDLAAYMADGGYTYLGGPYTISDDCPCGTNNFQCYDCESFDGTTFINHVGVCTDVDPSNPGAEGAHYESCVMLSYGYRDANCFDNCVPGPFDSWYCWDCQLYDNDVYNGEVYLCAISNPETPGQAGNHYESCSQFAGPFASESACTASCADPNPTCCPISSYPGHTVTLNITLANGSCEFCTNGSGTFTLTDVGDNCQWVSDSFDFCSTPTSASGRYVLTWVGGASGWNLLLEDTGIGAMLEWTDASATDCSLPATLVCDICDDDFCSSTSDAVISAGAAPFAAPFGDPCTMPTDTIAVPVTPDATDGVCCLELIGDVIYAVGSGNVTAPTEIVVGDCTYIVKLNGLVPPIPVIDCDVITVTIENDTCCIPTDINYVCTTPFNTRPLWRRQKNTTGTVFYLNKKEVIQRLLERKQRLHRQK